MARKDRNNDSVLECFFYKKYEKKWNSYTENKEINQILKISSKNNTSKAGFPDHLYVNEQKKLLILVEDKPTTSEHQSESTSSYNAKKYAVDGIKHYLSFFLIENIQSKGLVEYFRDWKIVGIAVSGDIEDEYNHRISTFIIVSNSIKELGEVVDLLDENDYENLFHNINEEKIISNISSSSKKINLLLRSIDSQKRATLLSSLIISLFEVKNSSNSFINEYNSNSPKEIIDKILPRIDFVLSSEKITEEKRKVVRSELEFIKTDIDLNSTNILRDILDELQKNVIPLFAYKSNYDIMGRFYGEFLRYAGIANVKKGIVLTPHHITSLFTDLVDVKINDVFFDPACGTGAFLIAGMQKLIELINNNPETVNKQEKIDAIRKNQLIGFEKNTMMYTLAISNMLFRGDGKSHIFNEDFFSKEADDELISLKNDGLRPTIGFVNPPYGGGGLENKKNPTPKEIEFLVKMLDLCSRYCVIIAPLSTYCKDTEIRNKILSKHTLKYVINMPKNLFMPNAATNTSIAVFETFKPQGETETIFFDLKDDGYVLTKNRGRYDLFNKWTTIKKDLIVKISNPSLYANDLTLVKSKIRRNSEWLIQDYSKTDYGNLSTKSFINTIKKYLSYIAESKLDLFGKNIDSLTLGELVVKYFNLEISKVGEEVKHCDTSLWKEFSLYNQYFDMAAGKYYPVTDFEYGETPLISASNKNNGVMAFTNMAPVYRQECLTIGKVDMSVFYQSQPFCATSDVTILIPKCSFNKYIAMFMITMISQEGYKWSYGRQIRLNDSQDLIVRLPSNSKGDPDWIYMENFIKKLPYSDKL